MDTLKEVEKYIAAVKSMPKKGGYTTQKEAAVAMNCSTRTVRRWARIVQARLIQSRGKRVYFTYDVQRMILRRKYNEPIKRFEKKYSEGFYKKKN